uniref:Aminopeptidase n=1 Tax=Sitophilus oryzae TaxID=7048 RepID=D9J2F7_SITOR|nr:aminopeptidase N [Sitophilus oryzae]
MFLFLGILLSLGCLTIADDYRLPTNLNTTNYHVSLSFSSEIFTTVNGSAYTGVSNITFTALENTTTVVLHASATYINVTGIVFAEEGVAVSNYSVNATTDILTVYLNESLVKDQSYTISLSFDANVSTSDMYGIYKSSYTESSGTTYYLVSTQFESTSARRAFPCLDEPRYKATFTLELTYPNGLTSLFNEKISTTSVGDSFTTTTFSSSPRMSTYLVALVVSDFNSTSGDALEGSLENKVWSRNETADHRAWALEVTPSIVEHINAYTGINYSHSLSKLDQVAIPDFAAGAMENWGLITYRERALLHDELETSNAYKQYIAAVISHELAHQWFGNLVTCKWWSEIFLNEGFATLLEYLITDEVLPDYQMDKQFVIKIVQAILEGDAATTEALRTNASTPSQISGRFSSVSYNKGGSVLRMVENILGKDQWRQGLNAYLNAYSYDSAEPDDLWNAIDGSLNNSASLPANLSTVLSSWVNYPGFPVLSVSLNGSLVTVSQERFVYNSSLQSNTSWYVPVTYTTSSDTSTFSNTTPSLWVTPGSNLTFNISSNESWIVLNNLQTGYYRVNYDSTLWTRLASALQQSNFSDIPDVNRAQIVNDAFNLARAGSLSYSSLFNITEFLASDTSYIVWYPAFSGFDFLLKRIGANSTLGKNISDHIGQLSQSVVASVPLSFTNASDHIYTLGQVQAQSWACKLNNTNCTNTALELFSNYSSTSVRPDKNLRSIVYCYGLKHSTNISRDWEFLWSAFSNTSLSTEQVTILAALGCSSNESILLGYLNKTLTDDSGIRSQDYASVFAAVYQNSEIGVDVALDFFSDNYNSILERYTSLNAVGNILRNIAELITTDSQLTKLKTLVSSGKLNGTILEAAQSAQSSAENNLAWVSSYRSELLEYYGLVDETSTTTTSTTTTTTTTTSTTTTTTTTTESSTTPSRAAPESVLTSILMIFTVLLLKL